MPPKTVAELCSWLSIKESPTTDTVTGFSVDSRTLQHGNVYFALFGAKVDGHQFLSDVAQKGASAAVVSEKYTGPYFGMTLIPVKDVLKALQDLAKKTLQNLKSVKIVGITGSLGKTTTKEFTTTLLSEKYRTLSNLGNQNSQVGMALTLLNRLSPDVNVIVLEMSMTHAGNLKRLVDIAPPDIAVITEVALVHAINFPHLDAIAEAKAEILSHPKTTLGIIPEHVANKEHILKVGNSKKWTFSTVHPSADLFLNNHQDHLSLRAFSETVTLPYPKVPGVHNLHNLLAAISIAKALDLSWEEIEKGIKKLKLPEKRLEFVNKGGALFVNDSYNASMLSVKAALETLPKPKQNGRRIACLGEMLELGKFSEECHRTVASHAKKFVDEILCIGEGTAVMEEEWKKDKLPITRFSSRNELVRALKEKLRPNDVVLLKGSRAFELWKVLDEF